MPKTSNLVNDCSQLGNFSFSSLFFKSSGELDFLNRPRQSVVASQSMRRRLITVQGRGKNRVIIWNYSLNPTQSSTTDREGEKERECRGSRSSIPFEPTEPNLEPRIGQPVYRRCCSPSCSRVQNVNEEVIISR